MDLYRQVVQFCESEMNKRWGINIPRLNSFIRFSKKSKTSHIRKNLYCFEFYILVFAHRTYSDPSPVGPSSCPEETDGLTTRYLVWSSFTNKCTFINLKKNIKIYIKIHISIALTCFGLRPSSGGLHWTRLKLYLC